MNIWDLLILAAVLLLVLLAVRNIRKGKAGSCHDCGAGCGCSGGCAACEKNCGKK